MLRNERGQGCAGVIAIIFIVGIIAFIIANAVTDGNKCNGNITRCNISIPHVPTNMIVSVFADYADDIPIELDDQTVGVIKFIAFVVCAVSVTIWAVSALRNVGKPKVKRVTNGTGFLPCQNDTLTSVRIAHNQRAMSERNRTNRDYHYTP